MKNIIETIVKSKIYLTLAVIGLVVLLLALGWFVLQLTKEPDELTVSATLTNIVKTSTLSGIEFRHNGIAPLYKNEKKTKVDYYVKYDATVKVRVDLEDLKFDVDLDNKKVLATLPELILEVNILENSELSFIPEKPDIELGKIRDACREDARKEAETSITLINKAKENIKVTVETLIKPILDANECEVVWEE